jgi:hypothetical protein
MGHELLLAAERYMLTGDHCDKIRLLLRLTLYEYLEQSTDRSQQTTDSNRHMVRSLD